MKKLFIITTAALLLAACSKDQKSADQLRGKWNATSWIYNSAGETGNTYNEVTEENKTFTYEFGECNTKKDDNCIVNYKSVDMDGYETAITYMYTVKNDGGELDLDDPDSAENDEVWTITRLTDNALEMNKTNPGGSTVFMILEKVE